MRLPKPKLINHLGMPHDDGCADRALQGLKLRPDCRAFIGTTLELTNAPGDNGQAIYRCMYVFHCFLLDPAGELLESSLTTFDRPMLMGIQPVGPLAERTHVMLWGRQKQRRLIELFNKGWPVTYTGSRPSLIYLPGTVLPTELNERTTQAYLDHWTSRADLCERQGGWGLSRWQWLLDRVPSNEAIANSAA